MIISIVLVLMYFVPAVVASSRKHKNATAITVLNLFLGWTLLVWIIALVWACTDNVETKKA